MQQLDLNKIHIYQMDGLNILLDINSGTIHVIDNLTWAVLHKFKEFNGNWDKAKKDLIKAYDNLELEEVLNEIQGLAQKGLLFSPDPVLAEFENQSKGEEIVKALCLHVAHDCNLRCSYCFAETGSFKQSRSLMTLEIGQGAIDFLIQSSGNRRNIEIDFFGGEPLLNFPVIQNLVSYGQEKAAEKSKELKFTLTTNGVLLDKEIGQFLDQHNIDVVLSLDGRPQINDKMRPFVGGEGSYEIIKDRILTFVNNRNQKNYYLRGTYTRHNLDFLEDIKHLVNLGFKEISLEPVVAPAHTTYAFREEDLPQLKQQYEELTQYYWDKYQKGEPFNFFHFNIDLNYGPCLPKRLSGCGAGHEYLAVSPEGDIYPCHQFVGQEDYKLGHIFDGIAKKDVPKRFKETHVLKKEECRSCWARFYCSGGCHASNLTFRGTLLKPYLLGCELQKKRLECAIYLEIKKHLNQG